MKKINDKEQAMYIAKRFQKRMLIPKIFFISAACILGVATLQEIVINNNFLKKDIFFYYIYYILGCRITFLHCLYPDCQHMPILSFFSKI